MRWNLFKAFRHGGLTNRVEFTSDFCTQMKTRWHRPSASLICQRPIPFTKRFAQGHAMKYRELRTEKYEDPTTCVV
jgi:hypothetical protein